MSRRTAIMVLFLAGVFLTGCSHQVPRSIYLNSNDLKGVVFGKIAPVREIKDGWIECKTKGGRTFKSGLDEDGYFVVKAAKGSLEIVRFAYKLSGRLNTVSLDQPYVIEVKPGKLLYIGVVFVSPISQNVYLTDDFVRDREWFQHRYGERLKPVSHFPNDKFYDWMTQFTQAETPIVRHENDRAYVAGVRFLMGDIWPGDLRLGPGGSDHSMIPPHEVLVSSFWMQRYPVSRADYGLSGAAPIEGVSWDEADRYCRDRGGRLPTEAEWELAARGPKWGDLNFAGARRPQPKPGADPDPLAAGGDPTAWPQSPYGIHFHGGRLAEWTADWFNPVTYRTSELADPAGPAYGGEKVVRVGPYRYSLPPDTRQEGVGFRCVFGGAKQTASGSPNRAAPPPAPPVAEPSTPTPAPEEGQPLVALSEVEVYAGPSRDAAVVAVIKKGTLLTALGESGDFYLVRLKNGEEGFLSKSLVGSRNGDHQ